MGAATVSSSLQLTTTSEGVNMRSLKGLEAYGTIGDNLVERGRANANADAVLARVDWFSLDSSMEESEFHTFTVFEELHDAGF